MANQSKVFLGLVCFLVLSVNTYAQNSAGANFGNYPANSRIAYFELVGFSKAPSIRDLFGPSAPYTATFQGKIPAIITLDSSSGTGNRFTAVLTLSVKNAQTGQEVKVTRMQVEFQYDKLSEKSYVRYVKIVNMMNGQTMNEDRSYGDQMDDGEVFGLFAGLMEMFWDVSKLNT